MTSDLPRKPTHKPKKTYGKNVKSHISGWFGRDLWSALEPADPKKAKERDQKKEKMKRANVEEDELDVEKQLSREALERNVLKKDQGESQNLDSRPTSTSSTATTKTEDIPATPEHEELEANILALLDGVQKLDMTSSSTPSIEDDFSSDQETNTPNNTPALLEELDHKSTISLKENSDKENDEPFLSPLGSRRASHKCSSDTAREALKERSISPERDPEPLEPLIESPARKNGVRKKGSLAHRMSGVSVTSPLKKELLEVLGGEKAEDIKVWEDLDGEAIQGKPEQPQSPLGIRTKPREKTRVVDLPDPEDRQDGRWQREATCKPTEPDTIKTPTRESKALAIPTRVASTPPLDEIFDSDISELTVQEDHPSGDFPVDDLLHLCTAPKILDFTDHIDTLLTHSTVTKLGEASYSEVFLQTTPPTDTNAMATSTVLKIIPFGGTDQCALPSIIQEVSITASMGSIPGYIGFRGAYVVRGAFPDRLMDEWDTYEEERGSENERPEFYEEDQLFAVIMLEMGGRDLEHFELRGWEEARRVFWQVAVALGKGEREREFEHRDLHFGNIVIQRDPDDDEESDYDVDSDSDPESQEPSNLLSKLTLADSPAKTSELKVSLIDYTLSRAICGTLPSNTHIQHAPLDDPALFTGKGDYQFDIYRFMRTHISSGIVPPEEEDINWDVYVPKTNVFWLHYLTNILLFKKGIPRPAARGRNAASESEKRAFKELEAVAKMIDPRKKKFNNKGEIGCAGELVNWGVEQGIMEQEIWGERVTSDGL